ncbi:unnamed protein product [Phytomonas sp. Hart1]|nr:unnamed protein product [Phytomonas sp. Hart1]|eukprot:CCW69274.1 unnamed protein product [Phytomonas sp. isolate Hart1]
MATWANRIYELRRDVVRPAHVDAAEQWLMKMMPKRPSNRACLGFWEVQIGVLNQFVGIWQFKSLTDRGETLNCPHMADKAWESEMDPTRPFPYAQSNLLMKLIYRESNISRLRYNYLMQFTDSKEIETPPGSILAATFQVVVGSPEGKYVHLIKNNSPDGVIPLTPILGNSSLLMKPAQCAQIMRCVWQ